MKFKSLILASLLVAPAGNAFAQTDPAMAPTAPASSPVVSGPATLADITAGAVVYDNTGMKLGTIESATAAGAVVTTGTARAQLPVAAFGKSTQGLSLNTTKAAFDAQLAKASPAKP